jgi:hypothetical protein
MNAEVLILIAAVLAITWGRYAIDILAHEIKIRRLHYHD